MGQSKLLVHPSHGADGVGHRITPASAGWRYVGFETRTLKQGAKSKLDTGGEEICVVILSGKARVTADGFDSGTIGERASVFDGLPWSVYLPPHSAATIEAASDCELALCSAPASGKFKARVIKPGDVGTLTRGTGIERAPCPQRPARRRRGRERARGRGHHARRQLVELPAAQARPRRAAGRILSRGDLLSPPEARRRASPSSASTPTTARSTRRWRSRTATSCWCRRAIIRSARRTATTSTIST